MENKKHWYNNGIIEHLYFECPEGWVAGRLPVSEATRKKHSDNNAWKIMTEEQKEQHRQHLIDYNKNKTKEQIQHKSEAISKAKTGKYKGRPAWNKGKKGLQVAWNKGLKMTLKQKEHFKATVKNRTDAEKLSLHNKLSYSLQGRKPWNKGKILGPLSADSLQKRQEKQYQTKKQNNSFNISKPESQYFAFLKTKFTEDDIITQYKDNRYPFTCDFYIKSKDLFIELNLSWTHGYHPFNINSEEDLTLLEFWKQKAETSDYYKNAIYTWTDLDVRKLNCLNENKLNYKRYYNIEEALNDEI